MEVKKLNGYKIDFYSEEEWNEDIYHNLFIVAEPFCNYAGLVSEISEELTDKLVDSSFYKSKIKNEKQIIVSGHSSKDNFIYTLSDLPYCVITKI